MPDLIYRGQSFATLQDLLDSLNQEWGPEDQGLIGWNFDPNYCNNNQALSAGQLHYLRVTPRISKTVTKLLIEMNVAGSGLTAGQNLMGLCDEQFNLLSGTPTNMDAAFAGATGQLEAVLATPVPVKAGNAYHVALLTNGTTPPTFRKAGVTTAVVNAGPGPQRFLRKTSPNTVIPSTMSLASLQAHNQTVWVGLSDF